MRSRTHTSGPIDAQGGVAPSPLRVCLLGGLAVEGVPARLLGTRKARTVLKVLALHHDRFVSADRLIDACWPDGLPSRPAGQLAVLASRLRSVVGRDRLTFGQGGYQLRVEWLDVDEFRELVTGAIGAATAGRHHDAISTARRALVLADGGVLPEDLDASWVDATRREVDRSLARVRRVAAGSALACGDFEDAAQFAEAALNADGYDEEGLRLLMLAYQASGRTAAGLGAYARVRAQLAEELGADPSRETEAVYLALLRDDDRTNGTSTSSAQPDESDVQLLAGRQAELARLLDELARVRLGPGRLVVIEGEAGTGKSALLQEFGRRAKAHGVLWLHGTPEQFFGGLPMQSVVDALGKYVSGLSTVESVALLAGEQAVLGRLLGTALRPRPESWIDSAATELRLSQAFAVVLGRMAASCPVVLSIDDVHLAGNSTAELLRYLTKSCPGLLVVAARRLATGPTLAADVTVALGPLSVYDAVTLFGRERGPELHARSNGNPLFMLQLASVALDAPLPNTLVDAIAGVAATLGDTAALSAAAVLGATVDIDLLAGVLRASPIDLEAQLDLARQRGLLDAIGDGYAFHHDLVREVLAAITTPARAGLLHREAAQILRARSLADPRADPLAVAYHARLGGETVLGADALEEAAALASQRFDRPAAEELLDEAIRWSDTPRRRLARARARTMRGRYDEALQDVEAALSSGVGAAGLEAGAWAAYFARRFDEARSYADDGATLAEDDFVRSSCLTVAGRVRHAAGDLNSAEPLLVSATALAQGSARAVPRVWLGVLRSHQGRPAEALELLRPITRGESGGERTTELLHALLFTAHAHALQGRARPALEALERYDIELGRRQVPRFAGRASNFRGWILRALGQWERADESNLRAVDEMKSVVFPETVIASELDLASSALLRNNPSEASARLDAAAASFVPNLTFGWRLELRLRLERARLALLAGDPAEAATRAFAVAHDAQSLGVARYATVARLVGARAQCRSGYEVDLDEVGRDVDALDAAVGIDAWWVTAETGRDLAVAAWTGLARTRAAALARAVGPEDHALAGAVAALIP